MKRGHLKWRAPRGQWGFSWARLLPEYPGCGPGLEYRLFLRDSTGTCWTEARMFAVDAPRGYVAASLRGMRQQLRWRVAQLELERSPDLVSRL